MAESLIHESGVIVEYYAAHCETYAFGDNNPNNHFVTESTLQDSEKQLLKNSMPYAMPDECDVCGGDLIEHYDVITWLPDERVTDEDAYKMASQTNGYIVLRFHRLNEPRSSFTDSYCEHPDKPLYVYWEQGTMYAWEQTADEPLSMPVSKTDLDELTTKYPVDARTIDETPFAQKRTQ